MVWSDRIGRRLKLQDLHFFLAAVDAGSMGRAARQLNTTQPAISRSIADLERALGISLLDRSALGVEPTAYGAALRDCGLAVFNELRQGVKTIDFLTDPTGGEVRVAGLEPIVVGLIPAIFSRLHRKYPGISIDVEHGTTIDQQVAALRQRQVDLVISRLPPSLDDDIDAQQLYIERSFVVAGANSPWFRRRKIKFDELLDQPWALPPPGNLVGAIFSEAFRQKGFAYPTRNVAFGHIHLHVSLVVTGQFLAILPGSMLQLGAYQLALKALPVECPVPPGPVSVLTLKGRSLSPAARLFIEHAGEVAKTLK
jgi:DNA-binding transcriptional LysR family regulator